MKNILFCSLLLLGPAVLPAQGEAAAYREVPEQQWKKAMGGLDYSRDLPEEEKKKPPTANPGDGMNVSEPQWQGIGKLGGMLAQGLAILIAVGAIGYGIYRMLQEPRNRRIARDGAEITLDNLEAYLHETDLDRFLREALDGQHYALAIRLYYLQTIKALSQVGAIQWSMEKTNRDYLREMRAHRLLQPFQAVTGAYERVWYGNAPLDQSGFARLQPEFTSLLKSIA